MIWRSLIWCLVFGFCQWNITAQSFQLHGHIQGGCEVKIIGKANEKPQQWEGLWMSPQDTFYWEGIEQGDTLFGFMAVGDNIAANFYFRPYAGDIWVGAWQSRVHFASYPLFLRERPLGEWNYHYLSADSIDGQISDLRVSRVARGQWRGHYWNSETGVWDDFDWLRGLGHSGPDEISSILQSWEDSDSARTGYPLQVHRYCDPTSLTEISFPQLPYPQVTDSLEDWHLNWKRQLDRQQDSLLQVSEHTEDYEQLWQWKAYAFVDIYSDNEKLLSFTLHSRDFTGKTRVVSWHYLPHKERFTTWDDQTRRSEKLLRFFEETAGPKAAWVFHPAGPVAVQPARRGGGIETQFLPHDEVKGHYCWFSSFRSLK